MEVYDTTQWGMTFEAPVGENTVLMNSESFQLSAFIYMAAENNTQVTHPDGSSRTLQMGQSGIVTVLQSNRLVSNKPIQVILATGDRGSWYETRWYTMRSIETYQTSYMTPVGDSHGKTKVIIYNPGPESLTFTLKYLDNGLKTQTETLAAKQCVFSRIIPNNSGALFEGNRKFVALSMTDTEQHDGLGEWTGSEMHDWGFPLIPRNELTSQVLIGLGIACRNNNCEGTHRVSKL